MEQTLITKTLTIVGMTCAVCESRIEKKLNRLDGIVSVKASYSHSQVNVRYDENLIECSTIMETIEELDYQVLRKGQNKNELVDEKKTKITQILGIGVIIFAVYFIINHFGGFNIFNSFPEAKQGLGYGALFLIGCFTSIHCVAMCGGINLSQCVPNGNKIAEEKVLNLRPSILYNTGRVISYTVVGGIVGAIGSVVGFSGTAKGFVAIIAGGIYGDHGIKYAQPFSMAAEIQSQNAKDVHSEVKQPEEKQQSFICGSIKWVDTMRSTPGDATLCSFNRRSGTGGNSNAGI